jgi:hypothetical protein
VAQPLGNRGDVGPVLKGVGRRCCPVRMRPKAGHVDADLFRVAHVDPPKRIRRQGGLGAGGRGPVAERSEQRPTLLFPVAGQLQVLADGRDRDRMGRQVADFPAFAAEGKVRDPPPILQVPYP